MAKSIGLIFKQRGKNIHGVFFKDLDAAVRAAKELATHDRATFVAVVVGKGKLVTEIRRGGLHTLPPDPTVDQLDPIQPRG